MSDMSQSQRAGQWDGAQRSRGLASDQDKADGGLREVSIWAQPKDKGGSGQMGWKGTPGGWNSLSKGCHGRQVWRALGKSDWFWLENKISREAAVDVGCEMLGPLM